MKLVFDQEDIESILIAHAQKIGVECNAVDVECGYSTIKSVTLHWDADLGKPAPMTPPPIEVSTRP